MKKLKNMVAINILLFTSMISGCAATKYDTLPSEKNEDCIKKELQTCLGQASLLESTGDEKYNSQLSVLYKSIRDTQTFYANRNKIDGINYEIIAPYYKFRVREACNNISIALLCELKKGLSPRNNIITKE